MSGIKNIYVGWLIDGTGGPVRKNIGLQIENGRIISINDSFARDSPVGETTDYGSSTILPCLVDSHVHLCMSGTDDPVAREKQLGAGFDEIKGLITQHIKRHLSYGILAVRDGGDKHAYALRYRDEYIEIKKAPIVVRVAGRGWHRSGRYGGLIGRPLQANYSLAEAIQNDHEDKDHIKVVNSGLNSLREFGKETLLQFSAEELSDVVKIARKCGRKVMVHANGKKPIAAAIAARCNSIEHGFFMGIENMKAMAEKGIVWVPTACTMKGYAEHLKHGSVEYEVSCMNLDHQIEQISKARGLGVTVALGTDAGSIGVHHGSGIIEELKLFVTAGYSLPEAIKCASCNGARLLGIEDIGVISEGRAATFLVTKGDPSKLPDSLGSLDFIYRKGNIVNCINEI